MVRKVKFSIEWFNITYDVEFAAPAFDLPDNNTSVLKTFYETINPRFLVNSRDMHVAGGNLLSDVHVRITLFNGSGVIDISADRMSLVFNNLRKQEDLTICKDCISLSEEALQKSLPAVSPRAITINATLFLELQGGEQNASNYLSQLPRSSIQPNLSAFGNTIQHPGVSLEVENFEEKWNVTFHAFRDRIKTSALILSSQANYRTDGTVRGLENRVNHLDILLMAFANGIGLELEGSTE